MLQEVHGEFCLGNRIEEIEFGDQDVDRLLQNLARINLE
jgi:hypothetical protein